jgi:hypothetical protein
MITFFNKTIAQRTPPGQRQSVQNEGMALSNTLVELNLPMLGSIVVQNTLSMYTCGLTVSVGR